MRLSYFILFVAYFLMMTACTSHVTPVNLGEGAGLPPATPQNLSAVVNSNEIELSWPAVSNASSYKVYLQNDSSAPIVVNTPFFIKPCIKASSTYVFSVTAVGSDGQESAPSNTYSVPTPAQVPACSQGGLTITGCSATSTSSTISVTCNVSQSCAGRLYYSSANALDSSNYNDSGVQSQAAQVHQDTSGISELIQLTTTNNGLVSGQSYYTYFTCVSGTVAASYTPSKISLANALPTPNVSANNITQTQIGLSWSAVSGATLYEVDKIENGTPTVLETTTATSYTDAGLTAGTSYSYEVIAKNATQTSAPASISQSTLPATPQPVSITAITALTLSNRPGLHTNTPSCPTGTSPFQTSYPAPTGVSPWNPNVVTDCGSGYCNGNQLLCIGKTTVSTADSTPVLTGAYFSEEGKHYACGRSLPGMVPNTPFPGCDSGYQPAPFEQVVDCGGGTCCGFQILCVRTTPANQLTQNNNNIPFLTDAALIGYGLHKAANGIGCASGYTQPTPDSAEQSFVVDAASGNISGNENLCVQTRTAK